MTGAPALPRILSHSRGFLEHQSYKEPLDQIIYLPWLPWRCLFSQRMQSLPGGRFCCFCATLVALENLIEVKGSKVSHTAMRLSHPKEIIMERCPPPSHPHSKGLPPVPHCSRRLSLSSPLGNWHNLFSGFITAHFYPAVHSLLFKSPQQPMRRALLSLSYRGENAG